MNLPLIAMTMGDGAGIGPEVTVATATTIEIREQCLPLVIGDAARLRQAAGIMDIAAEIVSVASVEEAVDATPSQIPVLDLAMLPPDLPWGELSAVAGEAAYRYIETAAELALAGRVQAICTAPINKEALQLADHSFPGHTELLAHLSGTPEVSMMLVTPVLRVIHVTTHIGLADALNLINPGLVYRTIMRGDKALRRTGLEPRIGVCALNPHAGENGLFGYGEEARQIEPGVRQACDEGVDVDGPLPADALFYLAARGDYDLVVAMYHDQGHVPVKVLGIDSGVNITVGLPVIRTSVDHGTAFDIAGTGKADPRSMIEAMRQAIQMVPVPRG